jgi:hypothetical protein
MSELLPLFACGNCDIKFLFVLISGAENWMQAPQANTNCPPGLEYLTMVDQLLVHQKVELLEGWLQKNK